MKKKTNNTRNKIRILNFEGCLHDVSIFIKNFDKNSSKKKYSILTKLQHLHNSGTF